MPYHNLVEQVARILLIYQTCILVWNLPIYASFNILLLLFVTNTCWFDSKLTFLYNALLKSNPNKNNNHRILKKHNLVNFTPKNKCDISKRFSQPVQQDYDMFILISYKYLLHKSEKGNFFVGTKLWKFKKPI